MKKNVNEIQEKLDISVFINKMLEIEKIKNFITNELENLIDGKIKQNFVKSKENHEFHKENDMKFQVIKNKEKSDFDEKVFEDEKLWVVNTEKNNEKDVGVVGNSDFILKNKFKTYF